MERLRAAKQALRSISSSTPTSSTESAGIPAVQQPLRMYPPSTTSAVQSHPRVNCLRTLTDASSSHLMPCNGDQRVSSSVTHLEPNDAVAAVDGTHYASNGALVERDPTAAAPTVTTRVDEYLPPPRGDHRVPSRLDLADLEETNQTSKDDIVEREPPEPAHSVVEGTHHALMGALVEQLFPEPAHAAVVDTHHTPKGAFVECELAEPAHAAVVDLHQTPMGAFVDRELPEPAHADVVGMHHTSGAELCRFPTHHTHVASNATGVNDATRTDRHTHIQQVANRYFAAISTASRPSERVRRSPSQAHHTIHPHSHTQYRWPVGNVHDRQPCDDPPAKRRHFDNG